MSSVKQLAIRGTIWTIATYGLSQIVRFASNLILTRLLAPELFGLMALVSVFIVGLHLFSDIGVGPSIIQNKRGDDPEFLNTAWTMQVVRNFVIWLCCLLIAWPASQLYNEPQLLWLIPVVGLGSIIAGFNSTAMFTLNRQMKIRQISIFQLGGQLIGTAVQLIWAWLNPTIWSLVGSGIVSSLVALVWSHLLIPGQRNRFQWDRHSAIELFSFGKWIFASTAVTFLSDQVDRLILGKLIPFAALGVYGVAFTLADIPRQVLLAISNKVFFPAFTRYTDLPRETFRAKILKNRLPFLLAMALGVAVLTSFGDLLITSLYDKRYVDASWMLPILALGIWPRVLTQTIDQVLFALGKANFPAYGCFAKFLFMVIGLPLGFNLLGLPGAIIIVALNDIPFYLLILYGLHREKLSVFVQDIQTTLLFLLVTGAFILGRVALGYGLPIKGLL
jgi:O-antigen/teichoic acid export membrane protein